MLRCAGSAFVPFKPEPQRRALEVEFEAIRLASGWQCYRILSLEDLISDPPPDTDSGHTPAAAGLIAHRSTFRGLSGLSLTAFRTADLSAGLMSVARGADGRNHFQYPVSTRKWTGLSSGCSNWLQGALLPFALVHSSSFVLMIGRVRGGRIGLA
jgi:hypothetical protein